MEEQKFTVRMAGLPIEIRSRMEFTRSLCRDYEIPEEQAVFTAASSEEDLRKEQLRSPEYDLDYLESLCIQRKIAERLPGYGCLLCHGAAITFEGLGYLFTAPSGTGKSTHIRLWRQFLGEAADIVNGAKPFLSVEEGKVFVWGSPWAGKENWQKNRKAPLHGICLLKQGQKNKICRLQPWESLPGLLSQIYMPENREMAGRTLELLDSLLRQVPVYRLECDISAQAVQTGFEAMTGKIFRTQERER